MIDGRRFRALWHRERAATFGTPLAWSVAAVFALAAGVVQWLVGLQAGVPASIAPAGGAMAWCMLLLAPALAVRSATEDRRTGFVEVLAAGPARSEEIALARFTGAMAAIAMAVAAGLIPSALAVGHFARLDWGELVAAAVGLLAVGAALVATGLFVGTFSRSAPVAAFVASIVWLAMVVCGQVLPPILGPEWAEAAFALDPMRRISRSLAGVLDLGDVMAFGAVALALLAGTVVVLQSQRSGAAASAAGRVRAALALLACLVAAVAIADAAADPRVGPSVALARGPSAPLSNETMAAIRAAPDAMVTLVAPESQPLPAANDLLARVEAAGIPAQRFDPDDLDQPEYAAWLDGLAAREAALAAEYDEAIEAGLGACESLARAASDATPELMRERPAEPGAERARAIGGAWRLFAEQWTELRRTVTQLLEPTPTQPFGDRAAAASLLRDSLFAWSDRVADAAGSLRALGGVRTAAVASLCDAQARHLKDAAGRLRGLPLLRHAMLTRAMANGSAFVVERGESLLARPGWMVSGEGLDARARAESLLLDALILPADAPTPIVVAVHAEPRSLLRANASGADLAAWRDALAAARFDVSEWTVVGGDEPALPGSRPRVWWIIPPIVREGIEPSAAERSLLAAANRLLDRGEPLVLSLSPSLFAVAGQRDPWADLARRLGVEARTDLMWLETVPVDEGRTEQRSDAWTQRADLAHPIGPAIDGLPIHFPSVSPLSPRLESLDPAALIAVPSDGAVTLSRDWRGARGRAAPDGIAPGPGDAIVIAVGAPGGSRAVIVGCPDWMLTAVARRPALADAGRSMLAAPGNLALAVAGSAWAVGQQPAGLSSAAQAERAARIPALSSTQRVAAGVGLGGIAPLALWVAGFTIDRRRRHA